MEQFQSKKQVERQPEQEKKRGIIVEVGCGKSPFFLKAGRKIEKDEHYIGIDLFPATDQPPEEWLDQKDTKNKIKKSQLVEGKADLVSATGDNLPLENDSVKEIIFKDVFGSPFVDSVSFAKRDVMNEKNEAHIAMGKEILIEEIDKRIWPEDKKDYYKKEIGTKGYEELNDRLKRLIRYYYCIGLQRQKGQQGDDIKPEFIEESSRVLEKGGKMTVIETRTPDIALQYIKKLKEDDRFSEIPGIYQIDNFVDSNTRGNKFNTAITFQKK